MHKNKNFFLTLFLLVFLGGLLFSIPQKEAQGAFNYQLLEKIPGQNVGGNDLSKYIVAIYDTALVIVVLSAVLMASIGGFMYLTSAGNTAAMTSAKGVIFDAVIGLVIALAAWLLLNVINPDLVNVTIKGLSAVSLTPLPPAGAAWPDDAKERADLGSNFTYNNANCKTVGEASCTSMSGSTAIAQLTLLQGNCDCSIKITGGTEFWLHGSNTHHKPGDSAVDIAHGSGVDNYILTEGHIFCSIKGRNVYKVHGALLWDEDSAHWHANFNTSSCDSI